MRANKKGTDWFDEVFQKASFTNVSVNYSGGSDKGTYYIGTEYFDQEGIIIHTNFKRYSARFNSVGNVKSYLRLGQNLNVTYSEGTGLANQDENGVLSMLYRIPSIIPVYDIRGNFAGNQSNAVGNARNPVAELTRNKDNKSRIFRAFGNAYLELDIFKGLKAKSLIGIDYTSINGTGFSGLNPGDYESIIQNSFTESNALNSAVIWTNTLNYGQDFGNHRIDLLAGLESIQNVYRGSAASRLNYVSNDNVDQRYLSLGTGTQTNNGTGSKNNLESYFGKIDYAFSNKYLASFTLRRDGSSRFPEENRWGTFPAASIGWIISEEGFMSGLTALNTLKFRAGWGQVGNQDIPDPNAANTFFGADVNYSSYDINGANKSSLPGYDKLKRGNQQVTWETTETLNVGLDAEILRNLSFSFDWFKKETKDMLVDVVQPATSGAAQNAFLNVGNVMNKGIELGLNYTSDVSKDFRYSLGVNFSTYKNEVVKLNSAPFYGRRAFDLQQMTITKEGAPISSFYGFVIDGIFKDQAEVDAFTDNVTQEGARPGTFRYRDVNDDGMISDLDRTIIGSPHPDYTYGFNLNLGYKAFELSITGNGVKGNQIFNSTRFFTDFWKYDGNKSTRVLDAWTPENTDSGIPQLNSNEIVREAQESTYYIEDGSYMRIRNVQLSYNLPRQLFGKVLSSAKIYFQGSNLFTQTKYSGLDPEVNLQNFSDPTANRGVGVDRGVYPQARSFMLGISASF
jgi:TonB-linked SusC/RagA family outer membrane protein